VRDLRRAADRFLTTQPGITSRHSFSFGAHYDPENVALGALLAHNDERLAPGAGFGPHAHADVELVTYVVAGSLRHTDAASGTTVLSDGWVQRLDARARVEHEEANAGPDETRFVQAWLRPGDGPPLGYAAAGAGVDLVPGAWRVLASGTETAWLPLSAPATLRAVRLEPPQAVELPVAERLHLYVVSGSVALATGDVLHDEDALRLTGEPVESVVAEAPSLLLCWSFS
jgi:redox-sensitive bicupin YhaK (pirin superfamily)